MYRLSGVDSGLLSLELPIQPMTILGVFVLRPDGGRLLHLDGLRRHLAARLDLLPVLRWRLQPVPFGLARPLFVDDPDFDLDRHLGAHTLAPPGDDETLDRYCAGLAGRTLDRSHPLWHLTLVDGLADGRQAAVLYMHHCLMDGFATLTTLSHLLSDGDRPVPPWSPAPTPPRRRLLAAGLRDQARTLRHLPGLVGHTRRARNALRGPGSPSVPSRRDVPGSAINRAFGAERRLARTTLPVEDLTRVRRSAGVTFNDVALAVVAGALRTYLQSRAALPATPLVARVPVAVDPPGAPARTWGNRISGLVTPLATDVADPWKRLEVIAAATAEAKRVLAVIGPETLGDWLEQVPPAVVDWAVRRGAAKRTAHPENIDANVVVSSLRGLDPPHRLAGAAVEAMYLTGPPNSGVGTSVVFLGYGERILVTILTFADSLDSPGELADDLHAALGELVAGAAQPRP